MLEFDPDKDAINIEKHGLSLEEAQFFEWSEAFVLEDDRNDYRERRYRALGMIDGRLHALAFTVRNGNIRAISLRKANKREAKHYDARHRQP